MSTKTFTFEGDGYKFEVTLEVVDGVVKATVKAVEGSADFNAFFWSDGDDTADFSGFKGKDSSLNMNGEGSQYEGEAVLWDDVQKLSNPGLGKDGEDKSTFIKEGESKTFNLPNMSIDEFNSLEFFGIRATSVNGEGSLKLVGKPEDDDDDDCTDHFPDLDRDISYVNFVFKLNEDASAAANALDKNDDGYVTVKIEMPDDYDPTDCANNLDSWYKDALAEIYKQYPALVGNTTLEGAFIKGGNNLFSGDDFNQDYVWDGGKIAFFSLDNDPGNDPLPDGLRTDSDGNLVTTGQSGPTRDRYDDTGNDVAFNPGWVPAECECPEIA